MQLLKRNIIFCINFAPKFMNGAYLWVKKRDPNLKTQSREHPAPCELKTGVKFSMGGKFTKYSKFTCWRIQKNLSPSKRRGLWNSWNEFSGTSNSRRSVISNLRSFEMANSWRPEVMNLQNHEIASLRNSGICWRSSSEVTAHEDFLNGDIHEPVRSKVKDVVSKSPGLVCELGAGL
jgi:hypothetical protein